MFMPPISQCLYTTSKCSNQSSFQTIKQSLTIINHYITIIRKASSRRSTASANVATCACALLWSQVSAATGLARRSRSSRGKWCAERLDMPNHQGIFRVPVRDGRAHIPQIYLVPRNQGKGGDVFTGSVYLGMARYLPPVRCILKPPQSDHLSKLQGLMGPGYQSAVLGNCLRITILQTWDTSKPFHVKYMRYSGWKKSYTTS